MTWPIVELTFWNPGDGHNPRIDPLLADPATPLAKHGLTGIATAYARETGAEIHDVHRRWAEQISNRSLAADGALHDVVELFERSGIGYFVAKGPVIAYAAYPEPGMRPYCDLDVYVSESDHAHAAHALRCLGYDPVDQAPGVLGGIGRELHGGRFAAIVELHAHPIDNVHRHHLPGADRFLLHTEQQTICGLKVRGLTPAAHLALQAIHAGAGHRYAKLVLLRDVEAAIAAAPGGPPRELGAHAYLSALQGLLRGLGRPVELVPPFGTLARPVIATLSRQDPRTWDEYRMSTGNVLALLHQDHWRNTVRCLLAIRTLGRARERRRVAVWGSASPVHARRIAECLRPETLEPDSPARR